MRRVGLALLVVVILPLVGDPYVCDSIPVGTWRGQLKLELAPIFQDDDCDPPVSACAQLLGDNLTFEDLQVGHAMLVVPSGWLVRFSLQDTTGNAGSAVTVWRLCSYRASGDLNRYCQQAGDPLSGTIPADTSMLRIILMQGAERSFKLTVYASTR